MRHHVGFMQFARTLVAWLDLELGRISDARAVFEELAHDAFASVASEYYEWPGTMAMLSIMCAELGDMERAAPLYDLLLPYGHRNLIGGLCLVYFGAGHSYLGLLAALRAQWDDAARHFEDALAMNTRMEMWPYVAHTRYAYADMLVKRGESGDRERALALLDEALAAATDIGMVRLEQQALALKVQLQGILNA
jgi:tetratricopeptide (TPR) repeat protein